MNEVEKYTALWALPQGYGNNYDHPYWKEIVKTLTDNMGLHTFNSIIDIGGGDQRLGRFFPNHQYACLDIAPNACEPGENAYPHYVADITEWNERRMFDWAISIDVMEHIPTDKVFDAIKNIAGLVNIGGAFLISTRPDRGGKKIGETLHMTVKPPLWWIRKFEAGFETEGSRPDVKLLRHVTGEYCLLVARHVW